MRTPVTDRLAALVGSAALSGCMSMSGLSGSSDYSCRAPEGVACEAVSGVYANAVAENLPAQRRRAPANVAVPVASPPPSTASRQAQAAPIATPLRSGPRILRLWFKPWEDADGDLFDQGYIYVQIDTGRWLVEHAQRVIREAHAPVRAPASRSAADGAAAPPSSPVPVATQRSDHAPQRPALGAPVR